MTDDRAGIVNAKMNELRQRYKSQLAERMELINNLISSINQTNGKSDYLELKSVAHKLAGTGTTFNFPAITETAHALETYIDSAIYNKAKLLYLSEKLINAIKNGINDIASQNNIRSKKHKEIIFPKDTKILIADDDEIVNLMLSRKFKQACCEITYARDGNEALRYLQSERFSLIILDGMMPGYGGIELVKIIRAEPKYSKTPVILLSATKTEEDIKEAIYVGADCYLTKPFNPEDVLEKGFDLLNSINN